MEDFGSPVESCALEQQSHFFGIRCWIFNSCRKLPTDHPAIYPERTPQKT